MCVILSVHVGGSILGGSCFKSRQKGNNGYTIFPFLGQYHSSERWEILIKLDLVAHSLDQKLTDVLAKEHIDVVI